MSGGILPYGYDRENGDVRVQLEEASVIRLMFQLNAAGFKDQEIATTLNDQGYQRRNGTPWTQRQVWRILHRRALYAEGVIKYSNVMSKNAGLILLP